MVGSCGRIQALLDLEGIGCCSGLGVYWCWKIKAKAVWTWISMEFLDPPCQPIWSWSLTWSQGRPPSPWAIDGLNSVGVPDEARSSADQFDEGFLVNFEDEKSRVLRRVDADMDQGETMWNYVKLCETDGPHWGLTRLNWKWVHVVFKVSTLGSVDSALMQLWGTCDLDHSTAARKFFTRRSFWTAAWPKHFDLLCVIFQRVWFFNINKLSIGVFFVVSIPRLRLQWRVRCLQMREMVCIASVGPSFRCHFHDPSRLCDMKEQCMSAWLCAVNF